MRLPIIPKINSGRRETGFIYIRPCQTILLWVLTLNDGYWKYATADATERIDKIRRVEKTNNPATETLRIKGKHA